MTKSNYVNPLETANVEKVQATLIENAGTYVMNLVRFEFMNSFEKNFDHDEKDGIREQIEAGTMWCDPTPQVAITFGDKDGKGVITDRLSGAGYLHADDKEVTEEMLNEEGILTIGEYICKQNEDGHFERIASPEKSAAAVKRLHEMINKFGITDTKMSIKDALQKIRDDKYFITVNIEDKEFGGKDYLRVDSFSKTNLEDIEEEEKDAVDATDFDKAK